ncbi:hypothetical protein RM574_05555 [Streptomyces sp. DSM 41982]|uniref:Nucleotidyltransferase domain-containing protein n=1 Tax=Streptomyces evansiae TaxID=3075535 RepID=A0ABD5E0J3_9ACTN|nr:hypothetical protein [Streptomyces sp. DSM 41982]MDT0414951.1 hypothetical protein [Streptomyces sp. DSM 41982]
MRVGTARKAAHDWVARHGRALPGFAGAYFSGSTVGLDAADTLSPYADVDLVVALDTPRPPPKPGKFRHAGALLEVTYEPWAALASPHAVLGDYHLAPPLARTDTLVADPDGRLAALVAEVARGFARPEHVLRRCAHAAGRVRKGLAAIPADAPWHQQVTAWLFPSGVTAHVLLVAALRNPTIRLRYPAVREVLVPGPHEGLYEDLLGALGCAHLDRARVTEHLAVLTETFDATSRIPVRTPFPYAADLRPGARPVAVEGSADLVERGLHREAVFWIVATLARCHTVLSADAPAAHRRLLPGFRDVLADLGLFAYADLRARGERTAAALLPRVEEAAARLVREGAPPPRPGK